MGALLWHARVVDDQRPNRTVIAQGSKRVRARRTQHRFIAPGCLSNEVVHRLRFLADIARINARCHWLDRFALARQ
jgi:hypothetical protein